MAPSLLPTLLALLALPAGTLSHSHLANIIINGALYHGFDPRPNQSNSPSRVGWSNTATDDGFVSPSNYSTSSIICHYNGASPPAHAPVRAGDRVHVQWNGWPIGHVGPVLSYLAPCGGLAGSDTGCAGVDKTALRWTKVDDSLPVLEFKAGAGGNGGVPGEKWATDVLIAGNNSWQVGIPQGLKTGPYVLRHEAIALHFAGKKDGAQNYPLCVNLWVEGDDKQDKMTMDGFDARGFYKADDPGVLLNVTAGIKTYAVPGPTVAVGATPVPYASQSPSVFRVEGTPVVVTRSTETVPWTAGATTTPKIKGRFGRRCDAEP